MFGLQPGQLAQLGTFLPYIKGVAVELRPLLRADAPDVLTVPPPPPKVRQLLHRTGEQTGVPGLVLEGLAAVLSGFRPSYQEGNRAGLLGVPVSVQDPAELADLEPNTRIASNLHAGASYLAREAEQRAGGLPAALVAFLELGEPQETEPADLVDHAPRLEARRLASAVIGYVATMAIARAAPDQAEPVQEAAG